MENQKKDKFGRWKKTQHNRFMKAMEKYGKNWPLVQKAVKTRTLTQVRSHAQKLFLSMTPKDMRQLNNDLDERFNLFCKSESQQSIQVKEEQLQNYQRILYKEQEEESLTIHRDNTPHKDYYRDVLIIQNNPKKEVSELKKEQSEEKAQVKAQYELIEKPKVVDQPFYILSTLPISQDYYCLPQWAIYYSIYQFYNQNQSTD